MDNDTKITSSGADSMSARRVENDPSAGDTPTAEASDTGLFAGAILLLVGIVVLLIVAIQNSQDVEFEFLWITMTTPLLVVILVTIAVAVLLDEAVGLVWRSRRRARTRERNELQRLRDRN